MAPDNNMLHLSKQNVSRRTLSPFPWIPFYKILTEIARIGVIGNPVGMNTNFMCPKPRCSCSCQILSRRLAATKIVWIQLLLKQPQRLKAHCGVHWRWGQKYAVMNMTPRETPWSMREGSVVRYTTNSLHQNGFHAPRERIYCLAIWKKRLKEEFTILLRRGEFCGDSLIWEAKGWFIFGRRSSSKRNRSRIHRRLITQVCRRKRNPELCFEIISKCRLIVLRWNEAAPWNHCKVTAAENTRTHTRDPTRMTGFRSTLFQVHAKTPRKASIFRSQRIAQIGKAEPLGKARNQKRSISTQSEKKTMVVRQITRKNRWSITPMFVKYFRPKPRLATCRVPRRPRAELSKKLWFLGYPPIHTTVLTSSFISTVNSMWINLENCTRERRIHRMKIILRAWIDSHQTCPRPSCTPREASRRFQVVNKVGGRTRRLVCRVTTLKALPRVHRCWYVSGFSKGRC